VGRLNGSAAGIRKRSVVIGGHKTSVNLADEFWDSIKEIAAERTVSIRSHQYWSRGPR
jgi:predicted DNA-binding ribbon-helix-helix protein